MNDQQLSPVLAQPLLHPKAPASDALRAAVLLLVASGHLELERAPAKSRFSAPKTTFLRGGSDAQLPPELRVVLDALFPPTAKSGAFSATEFIRRLQRSFGHGYGKYLTRELRPRLVARGLLEEESYRWLGVVVRRRHRATPAGAGLRAELEARLRPAAEVPALLARDPARAAAIVAGIGPLAVLAAPLRSHLAALAAAGAGAEIGASAGDIPLDEHVDEGRRQARLDMFELLVTIDWAALAPVLDALDGAADGGSDGGGDGGGGD